MDTHGLFDVGSSMKMNNMITTFSTLISSLQIYNIHGEITADIIQHLQVRCFKFLSNYQQYADPHSGPDLQSAGILAIFACLER